MSSTPSDGLAAPAMAPQGQQSVMAVQSQLEFAAVLPQQQNVVDASKLEEANQKAEEMGKKLTLADQEKLRIQKV